MDARNVYARDAKMALRPGLKGTGFPVISWGTDILAETPLKATLDVIYAVYDRGSRDIRIYRLDTVDSIMQLVGTWGTLNAEAGFPVVLLAEAAGLMFLAHTEPVFSSRLVTMVYTPNAILSTVGTIAPLVQDFVGDGITAPAPVYFSGVYAYLEYMCGWGYGTALDQDRGDIFHMSQPQAPLDWRPPNYAFFGVKKDPIVGACATNGPAPVGASGAVVAGQTSVLVVAKNDESYILNGTSFDNFTVNLLDARYGIVSPRAFQNVGGVAYGWSSDGPRMFTSQNTVPIAQPLELISPLPADFPPLGPQYECFSFYDLGRYLLGWCWPTSATASAPVPTFLLSLWNPQDPRWTLAEIQQAVCSAGLLLGGVTGVQPPAPVGYVSAVTAVDVGIAGDAHLRTVTVGWTNHLQTGSELVQLFARPYGIAGPGAWSYVNSFPVSALPGQVGTWDTALPMTTYDVALRYVNTPTPAVGYESSNPDDWTAPTAAGSKAQFATSTAPVAWQPVGSGVNEFVSPSAPLQLQWGSAQITPQYVLEKSLDAGVTWTAITLTTFQSYAYPIPPGELGTTVEFRVSGFNLYTDTEGPTTGPLSVPMTLVIGTPAWVSAVWSPITGRAALAWTAAVLATTYKLEKSTDGGATWTTVATVAGLTYSYLAPSIEWNTTVKFRVTGVNGSYSGTPSAVQDLALTVVLGTSVLGALTWTPAANGISGSITAAATAATDATSYALQQSVDGGVTWTTIQSGLSSVAALVSTVSGAAFAALINQTVLWRVIASGLLGTTTSNISSVATTVTVTAPVITSHTPGLYAGIECVEIVATAAVQDGGFVTQVTPEVSTDGGATWIPASALTWYILSATHIQVGMVPYQGTTVKTRVTGVGPYVSSAPSAPVTDAIPPFGSSVLGALSWLVTGYQTGLITGSATLVPGATAYQLQWRFVAQFGGIWGNAGASVSDPSSLSQVIDGSLFPTIPGNLGAAFDWRVQASGPGGSSVSNVSSVNLVVTVPTPTLDTLVDGTYFGTPGAFADFTFGSVVPPTDMTTTLSNIETSRDGGATWLTGSLYGHQQTGPSQWHIANGALYTGQSIQVRVKEYIGDLAGPYLYGPVSNALAVVFP